MLTAVLFGCGSGTTTQGPAATEPPAIPADGRPMGGVGFNHFQAGASNVKVVLKTSTSTDAPAQACDANDNCVNVTCTLAGTECAVAPGSHCGAGGFCVFTTTKTAIFYVKNATVLSTDTSYSFPVPCDGKSYAAEFYTATADTTAKVLRLKEVFQAPSIVVDTGCNITTQPSWAPVTQPSLAIPSPIYANLPAPNDQYTVGVNALSYPFSRSFTMTVTQGTGTPVNAKSYSASGAVFVAPTTTDPLSFVATGGLDGSILFTSEVMPWQWQATGNATPTGSAPVSSP